MNNILLIEDDMSINKILAYELRKKGYLVDSLYDGKEAVSKILEDAYVILDEAQNTTDNQMKMFLTRLGFRSKMIVTGDISQIDLPRNTTSGLIRALDILEGVKGISFIHLSAMDVVRHPVVQRIIERYDGNNE